MEQLFNALRGIAPLSPALEEHLCSILTPRKYRKNELLLWEGEISKQIFYIEKGLVRSYHLLENGGEVCNWFMKEGDICISVVSFFDQRPATDYIIAVENCQVWGISHAQLEATYTLFPEFERHGRLISNLYYVKSELRHQLIKRQTPYDKYAKFLETDPNLAARITNKHLASFLNVSERTFNRIRKEYTAQRKKNKV